MRIIYTSDLHGNLGLYRAAGEAAQDWGADAVIFGGDLCPGTPSASSRHLPAAQAQFLLRELAPLLETWRRARSRLRVLAIPGNDDCQAVIPALEGIQARGLMENIHRRETSLGNYTLVGLGFVPPTPFALKDFERRDSRGDAQPLPRLAPCVLGPERGFEAIEDLDAYLDSLPSVEEELHRLPAGDPARTIAVVHCPPFGTRCDVLFDGSHIGSRALRRWLEERQPLLSLHGHVHESPRISGAYFDRIGGTTVINPGCDHSQPHLVFINLENLGELRHSVYK